MTDDLHFYKFKPINKWLIESIVQQTIYAPTPSELNDPFDCQIDLERILSRALSRAMEHANNDQINFIKSFYESKNFIDNWKATIKTKGVYSFSFDNYLSPILNEPLMWSHYADEHKGVCLEYIIPKQYIVENLMSEDMDNRIVIAGNVEYKQSSFVDCILTAPQHTKEFTEALLRKYLCTKSPSWKYEQEGRLIMWKSGTIKLPKESLKSIHFGIRATPSDIDLVKKLATTYSNCNNYYQIVPGDDYSLNCEPITG